MRFFKRLPVVALASLAPMFSVACGGDDGDENTPDASTPTPDSGPAVCTPEGDHTFVVNKVTVPVSPAEAASLAFDLDGDENNRADNKAGNTLAILASNAGVDIAGAVDLAVADGSAILLVNVLAPDLTNATCAGVDVYLGANPNPPACTDPADPATCGQHLNGDATFDISPNSPDDAKLVGRITNGAFSLGPNDAPSTVTIELPLLADADPLRLTLIGARMQIDSISESGLMQGRLGGAIPATDVKGSIFPTLHQYVEGVVARDCVGGTPPDACCTAESQGATVITLFDSNEDCMVSLEEVETNAVIGTGLGADLDLLDAEGNFNPNQDGMADSLSLGLGFTAVKASFTPPAAP